MIKSTLHVHGRDRVRADHDKKGISPGEKVSFMVKPQLPGQIIGILLPTKDDEIKISSFYDQKKWCLERPGHDLPVEKMPVMAVNEVLYMDLVNTGKTTRYITPTGIFRYDEGDRKRRMPIGWTAIETPNIHRTYEVPPSSNTVFSTMFGRKFKPRCFHITSHDEEPARLEVVDIMVGKNSQTPCQGGLAAREISGVPFDFETVPWGMTLALLLVNKGDRPTTVSVTVEGQEIFEEQ